MNLHNGWARDVRIALGGVASQPWRARVAEAALQGGPATADRFRAAAEAELSAAQPRAPPCGRARFGYARDPVAASWTVRRTSTSRSWVNGSPFRLKLHDTVGVIRM